ncbi:MAG TPA: response regulator transcription factor [Ktedonobacterales bacterium]
MSGQPGAPITALIVDDDVTAREALRLLLDSPEITITALCATAEECLDAIVRLPPQVALVDMRMRGDPYAGVELIRQIRAISPATACLALTASDRRGDLLPLAFYAGARGYYRKGYLLGDELPDIVKRLAAGAWELDPEMAATLLRDADQTALKGRPTQPLFTPRERDILSRIARGERAGAIAYSFNEGEAAIQTSIRNIMGRALQRRDTRMEDAL